MIPFPEDRSNCIISVRKEDYRQFVEDFFSSPETNDYFILPSCDTPGKTLSCRNSCEEEIFRTKDATNFYFSKTGWRWSKWLVIIHSSELIGLDIYGDPIPYNPRPVFSDDILFGGDG